jgi:3',5'-cyclic AMP phosphodiesterase CpdA
VAGQLFRICCAGLWLTACDVGGTDGAPDAALDAGSANTDVIAVLPDTQFYACAYPEIFQQQTQWLVEQRKDRGIAMVIHTGDVVDTDDDAQWQVASRCMHGMDGQLPYLITMGNHDLSPGRASLAPKYFSAEAEAFEEGRIDNSYAVVRIAGHDWLVLGLEFGPRNRVVAWAEQVLSAHAQLPVVLFTHAYLYSDGSRYDRTRVPHQPYHPDDYALTPDEGINDGEDLWLKLVEPHENVRLVLSGHVIPDGTARSIATRASGSVVHQVLANYQLCDLCPCSEVQGGGGYLRLLRFSGHAIDVSTFSPHFDRWLHDVENEFVLELEP